MFYSEAERVFHEDVREKRKAASGVHSKTGKKGYVGKMLFPTDIMSRKDKYNYRKAGKIVSTNLYEEILTIDEFEKLEDFEKRNRMQYWRNQYQAKDVKKGMGIGAKRYYEIISELGLPKGQRGVRKGAQRTAATKSAAITPKETAAPTITPEPPVQEILVNGIHFVYSGNFSATHIQNQLLKFASLLDGETDEFYVELKLMQKSKS